MMQRYLWTKTGAFCAVVLLVSALFSGAAPALADTAIGSVGAWTTSTSTLPIDLCGAGSVTYNGYAYIMGGTSSSAGHLSSVYYAKLNGDGTVGSWTTSTNSLPSTLYYPSAAEYNGYLYVMGGYSSGFHNAVYYAKINADGSIGSWSTSTNALPQGMYLGAGSATNGYLYFLGGVNSSFTQLDTVYYAAINSDGSVGTWGVETNHMPRGVEDARSHETDTPGPPADLTVAVQQPHILFNIEPA